MRKFTNLFLYSFLLMGVILLLSISCNKDDIPSLENLKLTDIEGNVYSTLIIGAQIWMGENLKVTKYSDGTTIPNLKNNEDWSSLSFKGAKAYCFYNNDESLGYGVLYTYAAATNGDNSGNNVQDVCPSGWHIPSDNEWMELENYLAENGYNYDGTKGGGSDKIGMALANQTGWNSSFGYIGDVGNDLKSNNGSGFNALPNGYRGVPWMVCSNMQEIAATGGVVRMSIAGKQTNVLWFIS